MLRDVVDVGQPQVSHDITFLRGKNDIPDTHWFLYPDLIQVKPRRRLLPAASMEVLTAPWQVVAYNAAGTSRTDYLMYCRDPGDCVEEFKYLIDFLFRFQLLDDGTKVRIRMPAAHTNATTFLETAKMQYVSYFHDLSEVKKRLDGVSVEQIPRTISHYSEVEIGMQRE